MVKFYKILKDGKEVYKTTSLSMAMEYRKSNGGTIKNKQWIYDDEGFPHRSKG